MERTAQILYVKRNCLDDGPGIRTTVFFKGCPLSCAWCHNPESRSARPELSHDRDACIGCDSCANVCAPGAIHPDRVDFIDRAVCDLCFRCVDECPSGAMTRLGREMTAGQIVEVIEKDLPFFRQSHGGVTLSGGEPTLETEFCASLLGACKRLGLHTIVETCGLFDYEKFDALLRTKLDAIYFDVKLIDSKTHKTWCGTGNERILENLRRLADAGASILPRVPLVPGVTDAEANLSGIAAFLRGLGLRRVALLPYNPTWHKKMRMLGMTAEYREASWMNRESLDRCKSHFLDFEIENAL